MSKVWFTEAERDAITRVLDQCPPQPIPTSRYPHPAPTPH